MPDAHATLITRLRLQAADVERLTAGLSDEALATRTVAGKWSLRELVCHLHRIQDVFEARIDAMIGQAHPAIASYEPEGDAEFDRMAERLGGECRSAFLAARQRLAARLERLTPAEWHRAGTHPEFPHYDVHFAVEYLAHHEAHHVYQMLQRRVPLGKLPH